MLRRGWIERGFVVGAPSIPIRQWTHDRPDRTGQVPVQEEKPYSPPRVIIGKDVTLDQLREQLREADLAAVLVARRWLADLARVSTHPIFPFEVSSDERINYDENGEPWILRRSIGNCYEAGISRVASVPNDNLGSSSGDEFLLPTFQTFILGDRCTDQHGSLKYRITPEGSRWLLPDDLQFENKRSQVAQLTDRFIGNSLVLTPTRISPEALYEFYKSTVIPPPSILPQPSVTAVPTPAM